MQNSSYQVWIGLELERQNDQNIDLPNNYAHTVYLIVLFLELLFNILYVLLDACSYE